MTARGTATHGKSTALARAATGRGKARPAHTAHERQAEAAGAAFARGETGLGPRLTSAPAARFRLPGSVPRPLPGPLRGQLEQAYAADLSGLRLFDDAPAHAAARAFGAHAFAAGADLYFGAGAWQPDRADGRARIAHEVAHALQQAGRAASAGQMRLERGVEGEAGVQRDPVKTPTLEETIAKEHLLSTTSSAERQAVVQRHVDSVTERIPSALANQLTAAVAGRDLAAATSSVDKLLATVPDAQRTPGVLALFFDVYKSLGAHAKAATLVGKQVPPKTAFGSWQFYLEQRRQDASWVVQALRDNDVGRRYFPNALVRAVQIDFLSALDKPTPITADNSFTVALSRAIDLAHDYRPQMPEERNLVALLALREFDAVRRAHYAELMAQASLTTVLTARFANRRAVVKRFADPDAFAAAARERGASPEAVRIAQEVGRLAAPLARLATQYWDGVDKLVADLVPALRKDKPEFLRKEKMTAEVQERLPKIAALGNLDASFGEVLKRALALSSGDVPDLKSVEANRVAAGDAAAALAGRLQKIVADGNSALLATSADAFGPDGGMSDALVEGAVMLLVDHLHDLLVRPISSEATPDDDQMSPDQDKAVKRFIQVSAYFVFFAVLLGLPLLRTAAVRSRDASRSDLTHSHVALLKPFLTQSASLGEFARDFPRGSLKDGAFSGAAPIEWAYVMFDEDMMRELEKALKQVTPLGQPREFDSSPEAEPIVNTAMKAVWSHDHLPRRHRVPKASTILYVRAADQGEVARLVDPDHPKLTALGKRMRAGNVVVTPRNRLQHEDGFVVWELPDMTPLAEEFARVPGVVDLVLPSGERLGKPSSQPSGSAWLIRLNGITTLDPKIHAAMGAAVHARRMKAEKTLEGLYRRATNNERKKVGRLIAQEWEDLPPTFLTDTAKYDSAPRQAFKFTSQFLMGVRPDTLKERRRQMTALMLELAPVMHRRLKGKDRLDILPVLHGDLAGAADYASSEDYVGARESLLTGFDAPATLGRAALLASLAEDFRKTVQDRQSTRDLQADASTNELKVLHSRFSVEGGQGDTDQPPESATFMSDGVVYTLVKVHNSFRYQPELNATASAVDWGKTIPLGSPRLWVNGRERLLGEPAVPLVTMTTFEHDRERRQQIMSSDTAALSKLTWAVHQHFFGKDMEALGSVLNRFGRELITAMQILFPEFATEMAYAEIAASIVQFFGDKDFQILQGALNTDSGGLFDTSLGKLKDILDPEHLWAWFLMGDTPPELETLKVLATAIGRLRMVTPKGDDKTKSSTTKVLGRLLGVGALVFRDVMKVHDAVRFPVDQFALFVQGSPLLASALRMAAKALQAIDSLGLTALAEQAGADLRNELREMYVHFLDIIQGLSAFELPKQLIPLHDIIEMIVNMVIDFLPSKYSYPIRTSRKVGAVEELFQWIFNKVADLLIEHGLDPNRVWEKFAAELVNPLLKEAGGAVANAAKGLLDSVPQIKDLNAWAGIEEPAPEVRFVGESGADANQTASPKTEAAGAVPLSAPMLPSGGGRALDSNTRARAEAGYGHDFGHVRLHRGNDVDRALRGSGALAATSGSHVYIDSGRRHQPDLLNHELAHVLQQAGPRPLGERHATLPVRANAPGGGWRIDAAEESNADALAAQAREPADAPRPVRRSAGLGLQPKLDLPGVIGGFFKMIGDPEKLREGAEQLGKKAIDAKAMAQAAPLLRTTLFNEFRDALVERAAHKVVSFKPPFKRIEDLLVDYVLDNHESKLQDAMPHLLMGGLSQIQYGTRKAPQNFWIVNPEHLKVQLQQYFFGVTGVSVEIEFNTESPSGPDKKKHKTVVPTKPFSKIRFVHLHLPAIGGGAKLWNEIMGNSFDMTADDVTKKKLRVRRALSALDPGVGIYVESDQHKLKFSKKAMDAIKNEFIGGMSGKLDPDQMPTWKDYVDPDAKTPQIAGKETGQIGLRMGFYRDKGKLDGQRGTDRESHHTVQYLLMEYFSNTLANRPFPSPLSLYPNVTGKGKEVKLIAPLPDAKEGIRIDASSARGPDMPTLLLAASTHRSGVHVTAGPDEESGRSSQSATVHKEWVANLGKYRGLVLDSGERSKLEALKTIAAKKSTGSIQFNGMAVTPKLLSTAIHDATNKTYNDMRSEMNAKLKAKIDLHERKYYEDQVAKATNPKIFAKGKPTPAYEWRPVAPKLIPEVQERQKKAFNSPVFGFTTQ